MDYSEVIIKDKFRSGCVYLFKSWSAFRIALDKNPQILSFYNEDGSTIEINEMLETLYLELYTCFSQYQGHSLKEELSDCLFGFIEDYFQIDLADQSEEEISQNLIELHDDLLKGQSEIFNRLRLSSCKVAKYEVDFPIEGNQKVIFERDSENEDESDDEHKDKEKRTLNNYDDDNEESKEEDEEEEEDSNDNILSSTT